MTLTTYPLKVTPIDSCIILKNPDWNLKTKSPHLRNAKPALISASARARSYVKAGKMMVRRLLHCPLKPSV